MWRSGIWSLENPCSRYYTASTRISCGSLSDCFLVLQSIHLTFLKLSHFLELDWQSTKLLMKVTATIVLKDTYTYIWKHIFKTAWKHTYAHIWKHILEYIHCMLIIFSIITLLTFANVSIDVIFTVCIRWTWW
jgi:hypothetical protein